MSRRIAGVLLAAALGLGACAPATSRTTYPPVGTTPQPAGATTSATMRSVIATLGAVGLQAAETIRAFRPPEGPLLAAAPRTVLQVALPDDPDHGFIVIYALDSPNAALAAANDHAAWVASSIGRINFPPGARHVLQVLGSTVISFSWLPTDARLDQVGQALEGLGDGVTVPG
jgi:hypothetical protein